MNTKGKPTYGMVGGGEGAFIGQWHRAAIRLDDLADIRAGCFSRDVSNTLATGRALGLDESRLYKDFAEMARSEAARKDPIDFVVIVTPNNTHHPVARAFLEQDIHVVCDKPLTLTLEEAEDLERLARDRNLLFGVTYTYTGYPMVRHARELVASGELGAIRMVNVEYPQDWLATRLEITDHRQAAWRGDPVQTGRVNSLGDIGTHVENLASFVTGLSIQRLCARLDTLVPGRVLDDNVRIMVDYDGGASGLYWMSQVAVGHNNGLKIRVFGDRGGLEWRQEEPETMLFHHLDGNTEILARGRADMSIAANPLVRVPAGHPEGYLEAFATIYKGFVGTLSARLAGKAPQGPQFAYPSIADGVRGMRFIERCLESSGNGGVWVDW